MFRYIKNSKQLFSDDRLRNKIARGSLWVSSGNFLEQSTRLLRNVILTRLLVPEIFGLMAIILALNAATEAFTEIGIKQAVIQNPRGEKKEYLNSAWWISIGRAFILYSLSFFLAPVLADFYNNPELTPLIRIVFLSILFKGSLSPGAYVAIKSMQFRKWAIIQNLGGILGIITTITLALFMQNIWALVLGFTTENIYRLILSYAICPFRPGIKFEKESLQSIIRYAKGMLGLPILTFIFMKIDIFVLGKLCDQNTLGLYSMAVALAFMPSQFLLNIISEIVMPVFSKMQNELEKLNGLLFSFTSILAFIIIPASVFIFLFGDDLLSVVYGENYAKVALPFAIVFSVYSIRLISGPTVAVYFALGRPELHRRFTAIRSAMICILIYPAVINFDFTGAAVAALISMLVSLIFQIWRLKELININLVKYGYIIMKALTISSLIFPLWFIFKNIISVSPLLNLFIGFSGCLFSYGSAFVIFRKEFKVLIQPNF